VTKEKEKKKKKKKLLHISLHFMERKENGSIPNISRAPRQISGFFSSFSTICFVAPL
jgi:hypothetical protein